MLLRLRRSTLPAASVVTPFRTINVNWRRRAKRSSMSWFISSSLGMCELSKKGTLCGETLGPEKGSATLENIDCAMGLRSTREYGTATSAAKSEHQAEIYADYTYTGYMRMQMLRYVYQRISWYHLATDDRGRADLVHKFPMCDRPREGMSYFDPYIITPPSTAASRSGPCRRLNCAQSIAA